MYSPEVLSQISRLRAKVEANSYDLADCREAIKLLREGRVAAQTAAARSGKGKSKAPVNVDALFEDLEKL